MCTFKNTNLSRWEQEVRKEVMWKEQHVRKLRRWRSFGKTRDKLGSLIVRWPT
jgi:hypothetical protein